MMAIGVSIGPGTSCIAEFLNGALLYGFKRNGFQSIESGLFAWFPERWQFWLSPMRT